MPSTGFMKTAGICDRPEVCPWCVRNWWRWMKGRMGQMGVPRKGETVSFSVAASTSVRPPGGLFDACTSGAAPLGPTKADGDDPT